MVETSGPSVRRRFGYPPLSGHLAIEKAQLAWDEGRRLDAERLVGIAYQLFDQAVLDFPEAGAAALPV